MGERGGEQRTGARASLDLLRRNRDFRRLFLASVISLGGDWFLFVALGGLVLEVTGEATAVGIIDLRPGGADLPGDAVGGVARRPVRPPPADDRVRPRAHGDLRRVPVGRSRQPVARVRAARVPVAVRGGVRPRAVGGAAQRRRPRGPPDRQRARRVALGDDARGRRRARRRRGRDLRPRRRVHRRRRVVRAVGAVPARAYTAPSPRRGNTTSTSGSPMRRARRSATRAATAACGRSSR